MEENKLDFSRETVRIMDALDELQSALESLSEAMAEKGILDDKLYITAGVLDCGITDGKDFWYQVDNIEYLTDEYLMTSISRTANTFFKDEIES